jgi:hypothetical protein
VISQLPQTGMEIVYISVQSTTNKHPIFFSACFFFFPFSPWTAYLQQKTREKKQTNRTTKKTGGKQSKKKLQNPDPTLAHILRGWRNGIKYTRKKKKKNCEQIKKELRT